METDGLNFENIRLPAPAPTTDVREDFVIVKVKKKKTSPSYTVVVASANATYLAASRRSETHRRNGFARIPATYGRTTGRNIHLLRKRATPVDHEVGKTIWSDRRLNFLMLCKLIMQI